ncbi:MAG: hypothetical protein OXC07_03720 [Kistimonas sp.]|nr:hypothetical protein [Kistimonas sp.]
MSTQQNTKSINIRQIVYQALVEKVGVDGALMSRVHSDSPICISLDNGQEIFVDADNEKQGVFIFSEVDVKDQQALQRGMQKKAGEVLDLLVSSRHVSLRFTETGTFLLAMYSGDELTRGLDISSDLAIMNGVISLVVESGGGTAKKTQKPGEAGKNKMAGMQGMKGVLGGKAGL